MLTISLAVLNLVDTRVVHAATTSDSTNDPYYDKQWYLNGEYGINIEGAWELTTGSPSIRAGVIDSGINQHEDLVGQVNEGYDFYHGNNITNDAIGHGTFVAMPLSFIKI